MHVTLIMSVYNGASTIERAIRSVTTQTFSDWDLIVVDDASTDDSRSIIERLRATDPRISIIVNERNRGLAYSLNRAWRAASGELIARMDVDDISLPGRIEKQVSYLTSHPEASVLGTGIIIINRQGEAQGTLSRPSEHAELVKRMYRESPFFHPTVMIRKRVLEDLGGYDERFRYGQDTELWLRAYHRHTFHNLSELLLCYTLAETLPPIRVYWTIRVILTAAYREDLMFSKGWYALRTFAAACLRWLGFRRAGLNFVRATVNLSELGVDYSMQSPLDTAKS